MSTEPRRRRNIDRQANQGRFTPPGADEADSFGGPIGGAPMNEPEGEAVSDFEDAQTVAADDLPMRAADFPDSPFPFDPHTLNDELGSSPFAPAPHTKPPTHVRPPVQKVTPAPERKPEQPAASVDPFSAIGLGGPRQAPVSHTPAAQSPMASPDASPVEDFEALLDSFTPPTNVVPSMNAAQKTQEPARQRIVSEPVIDLPVPSEPILGHPATFAPEEEEISFDFLDEEDNDIVDDELVLDDGEDDFDSHRTDSSDEEDLSLADNTDFWATLESSPDEDDAIPDLEGALNEEAPVQRRRPSMSLFGGRPELTEIDPDIIERARANNTTPSPSIVTQSISDDDEELAPLERDEESEDPENWKPTVHLAARQAVFAGPEALSLISPNLKDDIDELNTALSSFAELEPGQKGFIRLSLRAYPEFKQESQAWLALRKTGQAPPETKPHKIILSWIKYLFSMLWFETNKNNPSALGGKNKPLAPGKKGDVKELTAGKAGPEEAQAWKDASDKMMRGPHYEADLRIGIVGKTDAKETLERIVDEVASGFDIYSTAHQELIWTPADPYDTAIGCMGAKRDNIMLALSHEEVGELARVPDDLTRPQGVQVKRSLFKQLPLSNPLIIEDPYNPPKGLIPLGIMNPRSEDAMCFGMRVNELDKHMYYVGATGTGKSELMKWLIFGVAKADYPAVILDPHGALSEDVLDMLVVNCPERMNDFLFCDLSDSEYPVALNPLDVRSFEAIEPTVQSIIEMLDKQMNLSASGAPRALNLATQALSALCEANLNIKDPDTKCTLLHVVTFFIDVEFRRLVMEFCTNISVRETFDPEKGPFELLSEKQQVDFAMPIIRAFQPLGSSDSFSAVFSAGENRLNFGQLISDRKIILVKLARFSHQKKLGEFVGALILPWLLSSMDDWGRTKDRETGEYTGQGCRVFIDEAPTILGAKSSAVSLLAESRKWDLGLITTSQYTAQFDKTLLEALFANTKSKISLALDPSESGPLAKSIDGDAKKVTAGDVASLPNFHYYANILLPADVGSMPSGPFSAACLPPINCTLTAEHKKLQALVRQRSRDLICNRKEDIVEKRAHLLEHIKGALGQMLIERADSADNATGGGSDYGIPMDPLDDQRSFGGW